MVYSIPTFGALKYPILLDIATAQVAHGKIQQYEAEGWQLPGEWAVSTSGEPITDPDQISEWMETEEWGAIRPLGGTVSGYKGTGLAVISELFAGIMGAGPIVGQTDPTDWFSNQAAFMAFDPTRFTTEEDLREKIETLNEHLKSGETDADIPVGDAAKGDDILLPGEAEFEETKKRSEDGIPLPPRVVASLEELARDFDLADRIPTFSG
jgi:uncharacterized oxidoreductase